MAALVIAARTYDELQLLLMQRLSGAPETSPRGMRSRELLAQTLHLSDPRARLSTSPARAANYGFAAGEFLWYLRGAEDLESIAYYNRRMRDYSDDGRTLNSAYGRRLRVGPHNRPSQWEEAAAALRADPDSRRAVMTVYSPADLSRANGPGTKDVPCTMALQFFIRDVGFGQALHLHVTMRSNDVVWGLANDLFSFTLLQETMLLDLQEKYPGLELGSYFHTAGSMHLYERHYALAERIVGEFVDDDESCIGAPMPPVERRSDLQDLLVDEFRLREGHNKPVGAYGGGAKWLLDRLAEHRARRDAEAAS